MPTDEWVAEHWGLVRRAARDISERHKLQRFMDDLLAFGGEGLLEAKARFDPARGTAFSTYAWYYIRGRMLDGCRSMGLVARRGRDAAWAERALNRARLDELEGGSPNPDESPIDELVRLVTTAGVIHLLSDDECETLDLVCPEPTPAERAEAQSVARWMRRQIAQMGEPHREILVLSYFEDRTLDDLAARFDWSRSWASRMRTAALEILRKRLLASGWRD